MLSRCLISQHDSYMYRYRCANVHKGCGHTCIDINQPEAVIPRALVCRVPVLRLRTRSVPKPCVGAAVSITFTLHQGSGVHTSCKI